MTSGEKPMFKMYYERLLHQLSLDFNCTPEDLRAKENRITFPALKEERRSYSPGMPFMQMGDVPFYGTAAANIQSQNIAYNSGFRPAWVETEAVKI